MLRLPRGARWTWQEDQELVAAVRAGADLALIAEQRGRTRGAIVSRLLTRTVAVLVAYTLLLTELGDAM